MISHMPSTVYKYKVDCETKEGYPISVIIHAYGPVMAEDIMAEYIVKNVTLIGKAFVNGED